MADGVLENVPVIGVKRTFPRSFGRYILEKSLSRGGMGEVFLTIAKGVNQRCVIKTIRGDLTGDEEFIGRFADEAKIMMRIQHENIIRVFDAGRVGSDYYIAMEYVHGRDLGDVLDRAYERGEPMPMQLGLYVAHKLLEGLDYAHKLTDEQGRPMGIVHRDISPQNVLIGLDGAVKLIDFGLARTDLLPARTQGALAVGKYGYMSPEQARHEKIDGRADIYSTGVMLFEVFTGDRLVDEQDQATLWSRVLSPKHRKPSAVVSSLPIEIDDLVMTAVAIQAGDRFSDAGEMRDFVQALRNQSSNREDLVRYLRTLYPKLDFSPPPIPEYRNQFDASEKSMIIATSREGAMSVFGRGEMPIEWTTQIDAAELQQLFAKQRDRGPKIWDRPNRDPERANKDFDREIKTDANMSASGTGAETGGAPEVFEPTWVRNRAQPPDDQAARRTPESARKPLMTDKGVADGTATQISEMPGADLSSEATRYIRSPDRDPSVEEPMRASVDSETEHHAPILGASRVIPHFRDDEMTVMMDAPPRSMVRPPSPASSEVFADEDTRAGDAPTRVSQLTPPEDDAQLPTSAVAPTATAIKGRAIQERNSARERERDRDRDPADRTNLRDRTDRTDRPERPDRADRADRPDRPDRPDRIDRIDRIERPDRAERTDRSAERERGERSERSAERERAAPKGGARPARAAVAHRVTVPSDTSTPERTKGDTIPPVGEPESTEPEARRAPAVGILPAIILISLGFVIILLVILLLRLSS